MTVLCGDIFDSYNAINATEELLISCTTEYITTDEKLIEAIKKSASSGHDGVYVLCPVKLLGSETADEINFIKGRRWHTLEYFGYCVNEIKTINDDSVLVHISWTNPAAVVIQGCDAEEYEHCPNFAAIEFKDYEQKRQLLEKYCDDNAKYILMVGHRFSGYQAICQILWIISSPYVPNQIELRCYNTTDLESIEIWNQTMNFLKFALCLNIKLQFVEDNHDDIFNWSYLSCTVEICDAGYFAPHDLNVYQRPLLSHLTRLDDYEVLRNKRIAAMSKESESKSEKGE